jgi:hypothetical protein
VFPLSTNGGTVKAGQAGKSPCVTGWQNATLKQSKEYLEDPSFKNNNWGLLTGERNGLFVLDLDLAKPDKGQLSGLEYVLAFMDRNKIDCSYVVETGSGGGHLYFKWDEHLKFDKTFAGIQINGLNYGIDVRSNVNGQIVLPGSNHYASGNRYELIKGNPTELQTIDKELFDHLYGLKYPTTPLQRTITPRIETRQESTIRRVETTTNHSIDPAVKTVIDQLGRKRSDSRDDWIRVLLFLKSRGESYKGLAREFSKKSDKYEENAFEKEWDGLNPNRNLERPLTLATFCYWLQEDASYVQSSLLSHGEMHCSRISIDALMRKYTEKEMEGPILDTFRFDLQSCVARITETTQYVVRTGKNRFQVVDFVQFKKMVDGCGVSKADPISGKKNPIKMYQWIHEEHREDITFSYKGFRPIAGNYMDEEENRVCNLFWGFGSTPMEYDIESDNHLFDETRDDSILGFVKNVLANESSEIYEYLLDWMRRSRHDPEHPPGVSLVFISEEGSGKNTFWEEFFGDLVIGLQYSLTTEGTKRITDNFNSILENKLFIAVDEVKVKKNEISTLKRLITGKKLEIHQKTKDLRLCENYANYVFMTNDEKPFEELNKKQRRFLLTRMSDKYAGKEHEGFWKSLRRNLLNPEAANKFTKYLLDRTPRENMRNYPQTTCFQEMIEEQDTHLLMEYLEGEQFMRDFPSGKAQSSLLLEKSNAWLLEKCKTQKFLIGPKKLSKICKDQLGWSCLKTSGVMIYEKTQN